MQKLSEYTNTNTRDPFPEVDNNDSSLISMKKDSDAASSEFRDMIQKDFGFSDQKDLYNDQSDVFPIKFKREVQYHELILSSEVNVPSIFLALKNEVSQSRAKLKNIDFIDEVNRSSEEFYFIFNHYLLVRVNTVAVSSSEKDDQYNQIKSFNNETALPAPKNATNDSTGNSKAKRDRMVVSGLAICFFSAEDDKQRIGDVEFFYNEIQTIVERFSLEKISKFLRRMGSMRSDTFLAKDFLYSKERREYTLIVPIVNDWANFLFIIKNNLHQYMSEVYGKIDLKLAEESSGYSNRIL